MAQVGSKQKMEDGKRKCQICGLTFTDIYAYTDHLESKEHIKGIMKKKYGAKYLAAKAELEREDGVNSADNHASGSGNRSSQKSADTDYYNKTGNNREGKLKKDCDGSRKKDREEDKDRLLKAGEDDQESTDEEDSDDDAEVYVCQECKKVCTGILSYQLHLSGKKHLKTIKRNKMVKQMQKEKILPESEGEDDTVLDFNDHAATSKGILCKVCNKTCSGPQSYKQHNQSEGHRKKLVAQKIVKDMSDQAQVQNAEDADSDEDHEEHAYARCDTCSKSFSGPVPYQQHMESTAHFKQTRHSKQLAKYKDLLDGSTKDDNRIQCKECNRYFSGPLPYKDHLKSSVHEKQREKNDLIKSLKDKYKEMTIRESMLDSDDSDDNRILSCAVCHIVFSGPESARDHFQSQKHKKVVKEKNRHEKLKLLRSGKKSKSSSNEVDESVLCDSDNDSMESFDIIG